MRKKQLELSLEKGRHGGRRSGAGRKRIHSRGVAHRVRERVTGRTPMHINFKYRTPIRNKLTLRLLKKAVVNARGFGLRVIHFSLETNHIHIIAEAENNEALTQGMRSLTITLAKGINKGKIQVERYHLHVLRKVQEAKNAIRYVLFNSQKHGSRSITEYSSLLHLKEAYAIIKKYCREKRVLLKAGKREEILEIGPGKSFLAIKALSELIC